MGGRTQHFVEEVLTRFVELSIPQLGAVCLVAHVVAVEARVLVVKLRLAGRSLIGHVFPEREGVLPRLLVLIAASLLEALALREAARALPRLLEHPSVAVSAALMLLAGARVGRGGVVVR